VYICVVNQDKPAIEKYPMKFVVINTKISLSGHEIIHCTEKEFYDISLNGVDYVIVSGGDGLLRRIVQHIIFSGETKPAIIIDAKGSFNVIAKKHFIPKLTKVLNKIQSGEKLHSKRQDVYKLNNHIFLFSAGNLHDALHIHLSEILRVGFLKKGALKYIISSLLIIPITLLTLPFLLFSKKRFFIITPIRFGNFMNIYSKIDALKIDLGNSYNLMEIDGDLIILQDRYIEIKRIDSILIVTG
jgi:hypothetical protein